MTTSHKPAHETAAVHPKVHHTVHKSHKIALAAAHAVPHDDHLHEGADDDAESTTPAALKVVDPHATDARPSVFNLTGAQQATLETLDFISEYTLAHLHRVSPDIAVAFDAATIATIRANVQLGGPARADRIAAKVATYNELLTIAGVLSPLVRLVGQNLLQLGSELALEAGEPLQVARGLKRSMPAMLVGLASLAKWTSVHHGGGRGGAAPAAAPVVASTPAATPTK